MQSKEAEKLCGDGGWMILLAISAYCLGVVVLFAWIISDLLN